MHSSDLANTRFSTTKFREGYDMADVDSYIAKIHTALTWWESGSAADLTSESVSGVRFALTKFRTGYSEADVDNFLDEVTSTLASYEQSKNP